MGGGLVRCVGCGEVQWNLRPLKANEPQSCRVCGAELRVERRRPGRRFKGVLLERRDAKQSRPAGLKPTGA